MGGALQSLSSFRSIRRDISTCVLCCLMLMQHGPLPDPGRAQRIRIRVGQEQTLHFSEFVVSERQSSFLDPLGFMRPAGVLQDRLFEQFTVLSNHPAYHGMLCVILKFLSRTE